MTLDAFWRQTPGETSVILRAHRARERSHHDLATYVAWRAVAFHRSKRLPRNFTKWLKNADSDGEGKSRKRVTDEERARVWAKPLPGMKPGR